MGYPPQTHELASGSPAIDAGDDAQCPAVDERGIPRPVGAHCDIGAFEFAAPPTLVTGAATNITLTSATLHGTANPNGSATTAFFEYGQTMPYDSATPGQAIGAGTSPVAIDGESEYGDCRSGGSRWRRGR